MNNLQANNSDHHKPLSRLIAIRTTRGVELRFRRTEHLQNFIGKDFNEVNIQIFRQKYSEYEFGQDNIEYFNGITCAQDDLIFDGQLTPEHKLTFSYIDDKVKAGVTYAYWVGIKEAPGKLTGPVPVRVRDLDVWWPIEKIDNKLKEIADKYSNAAELQTFGRTAKGKNINGIIAGNKSKLIAAIGVIHAGESGPELLIPALEKLLAKDSVLLQKTGLAILPVVNIDERQRQVEGCPWYLRTNATGTDINRNFPANWEHVDTTYGLSTDDSREITYRGPAPASEPETKAVMNFIEQNRPLAVFTFHALCSLTGACFLTSAFAGEDKAFQEKCEKFTKPYHYGMRGDIDYEHPLYYKCASGSLPHWLYKEHNIPAFDLEWERSHKPDVQIIKNDQTTPKLVKQYSQMHYQGLREVLQTIA